MRKPTTRQIVEKLKRETWRTRESAERALKIAGLSVRGVDYELRQEKPNVWRLLPYETKPAVREDKVVNLLRKQPGRPPRGEPTVVLAAEKPAGRKGGNGHAEPAPEPVPEPAKPDPVTQTIVPLPDLSEGPPPVELSDLLKPLPTAEGPYEIIIAEGSGPAFPNHAAHTAAIDISRRLRQPVLVRSVGFEISRVYDAAAIAIQRKEAMRSRRKPGRAPSGESKFDRAARLLFREQGATAQEIEAECDWERVTQRHINRASMFNGAAKITVLGERRWRLEKPTPPKPKG